MAYSAIESKVAKPVANYKMATRMESGRLLYVSGQVARNAAGNLVGKGDIRAQTRQVFDNLRQVLHAEGGDLRELMKINLYLTKLEDYSVVAEERTVAFGGAPPASTLIVVKGLFHPDYLIEIEGVAAIS